MPKKQPQRRVKVVPVTHTIFEEIFREGYSPEKYVVTEGLPEGSELIGIRHDVFAGVVHFLFTHPSFDKVKIGDVPPTLDVTMQSIREADILKSDNIKDENTNAEENRLAKSSKGLRK